MGGVEVPSFRYPPAPGSAVLREKSCGVVPYRKEDSRILYLVISSALTRREHWEFPKGGVEAGEREIDTALRELMEETGVTDVTLVRGFREPIHYIYRRPEGLVSKQVVYFLGAVNDPRVVLREVEAKDYRWATYEEAKKLLRHANARSLLDRAQARITGRPPVAPQRPATPAVADAAEKAEGEVRRRRRRRGRRRRSGAGAGERPAAPAVSAGTEARAAGAPAGASPASVRASETGAEPVRPAEGRAERAPSGRTGETAAASAAPIRPAEGGAAKAPTGRTAEPPSARPEEAGAGPTGR